MIFSRDDIHLSFQIKDNSISVVKRIRIKLKEMLGKHLEQL